MVAFYRRIRRVVLIIPLPCIVATGIDGISVAVEFPDSRHGYRAPQGIIIPHGKEVQRTSVCRFVEIKLPYSVQSECLAPVNTEGGMHRFAVLLKHLRVKPVGKWTSTGGECICDEHNCRYDASNHGVVWLGVAKVVFCLETKK